MYVYDVYIPVYISYVLVYIKCVSHFINKNIILHRHVTNVKSRTQTNNLEL